MRIYLASRFDRQAELREYAETLHQNGHDVVSSWLWEETDEAEITPLDLQKAALKDSIDLVESEVLMLFTGDDESVPRALGCARRASRRVWDGNRVWPHGVPGGAPRKRLPLAFRGYPCR